MAIATNMPVRRLLCDNLKDNMKEVYISFKLLLLNVCLGLGFLDILPSYPLNVCQCVSSVIIWKKKVIK